MFKVILSALLACLPALAGPLNYYLPAAGCETANGRLAGSAQKLIDELNTKRKELESALQSNKGLSKRERAARISAFGDEIQPQIKHLSPEERLAINYEVAKSVVAQEQFGIEEYRKLGAMVYDELYGHYIHLSEFAPWVEGFVDRKPPYSEKEFEIKVMTPEQMRQLITHNYTPVYMELHDSRHAHYSVGHPRGVGLYYMSARGQNAKRYEVLLGLYESIDDPKYNFPHQRAVNDLFLPTGMTIEQAMVEVGRMSPAKIDAMVAKLGYTQFFNEKHPASWRPAYVPGRSAPGEDPNLLNAETDQFVKSQTDYRLNPANARYYNYQMQRPPPGDTVPEDDPFIH